jgi:hypothetical protein
MAKNSISVKNIVKPAPRWYRILKKAVYGLFATVLFSDPLQRFGVSDGDVNLISGFIIAFTETLGSILANGEEYAKSDTDAQ